MFRVKEPSGGASPVGGWTSTVMSLAGVPLGVKVSEGTAFDERLGSWRVVVFSLAAPLALAGATRVT
jgi:hypothetical protein